MPQTAIEFDTAMDFQGFHTWRRVPFEKMVESGLAALLEDARERKAREIKEEEAAKKMDAQRNTEMRALRAELAAANAKLDAATAERSALREELAAARSAAERAEQKAAAATKAAEEATAAAKRAEAEAAALRAENARLRRDWERRVEAFRAMDKAEKEEAGSQFEKARGVLSRFPIYGTQGRMGEMSFVNLWREWGTMGRPDAAAYMAKLGRKKKAHRIA